MKLNLSILFILITFSAISQNQTIDLAKSINETNKKTVQSNSHFTISATNKLPLKEYSIAITKRAIPIEEFELPREWQVIPTPEAGTAECASFIADVNALYTLEKEEELVSNLKGIRTKIKEIESILTQGQVPDEGCRMSHVDAANETISLTNKDVWEGSLKRGEQVEIVISRVINSEIRKWTHIFSAEPRGEWQVSYGFSFIGQGFNEESVFFTSEANSEYTIMKECNRKSIDFSPALFFSWMPTKAMYSSFNLGLSGGLGFDFEHPTVFLSPTISYNQNLRLHIGIVANKQNVLLGKYNEGQVINASLSQEQLHEQMYKLNPFISLSFRFNQNPFNQE